MSFEDDEYWDDEYSEYSFMPSSAVMQEQHYTKRTVPDPVIPTRRRAGGADEVAAQQAKRTAFDGERPSWLNDPDFEPIDTSVDNLVGDDFDDIDFNRPELGVDFDKPDFPIIDPAARPDLRRGAAPRRRGPDRYDPAAGERRDRRADDREPGRPSGGRSERRPDGRSEQRLDGRSEQRLDGRSERRDSRYAEPRYRDEAPGGRDGYERGYRDDWDDRRQPSRRDRDDRREPARADWNEPVRDDRRDPRADRAGSRDPRDVRDSRDIRDTSDIRGSRDPRDSRDLQDPRDSREVRDTRDLRDSRDPRRGEGREPARADWADSARREGGRSEWAEPSRDERRDSRPPRDDRRGRRAVEIGPDELWNNDGDLGRERAAEPVLEDERPAAGRTIELGADEFWEEPAASRDNVAEIDPERQRGPAPASRNEPGRAAQTWDDENFGPIRPPGGRRPRRDEEEPRRAPAPRRDDLAVTGRAQVSAPGAEDPYESSRPDGERRGALPASGDSRPALAPDQRPAARESADRQRPGTQAPGDRARPGTQAPGDRARPGTQEPGDLRQAGTGNTGDPQRAEQRQRSTGPEAGDGQRSAAWDADGQRLAGGAWANGPGTTASGVAGNETSGSGAGRAEDGRGQTGFGSAAPAQGAEVSAPVEAGRGVPPVTGGAAVRDGRDARPQPVGSYPDGSGPAPAGARGQAPSEPGGQVAAAGSGATEPPNADASREGNERRGESWRSKVVRLLPGQRRAATNSPTEPTVDLTDRGRGPDGSAAVAAQAQEPHGYGAEQAPRDPAAERGQPGYGTAPGTERHGSGDQIRSGMEDGGNQPGPGSGRDADRSGSSNVRDADRSNSGNERGMSQPGSSTGQPPVGHGPGGHRVESGNGRGTGGEAGTDRVGTGDEETRDLRESGSWPAPGSETAGGSGPREDGPRVVRRAEPPVPPKVVSRTTPPPAPRVIKADPPAAPRVVAAPTPVPPARVIGPNGPQPAVEPARPAAGTDAAHRPHEPAPAQWSGPDATSHGRVAPHDPATAQRGAAAPHDPAMTQRGGPDAAPRGGAAPHDPGTAQWAESAGVPGDPAGGRWGGPVDPRGGGAGEGWQTNNPYVTGEIRRPDEGQPEVPQQRSRRSPRAAHVFLAEGDGPWAMVPDEAQPPAGSRPVSPARPPVVPGPGAAGQPGTVPGGQPGTVPGGQPGAVPGGQPSPASAWPPAVRPDASRPVSGAPAAPRPESAWPPAVQQGPGGDRQAWPVSGQQPPSAGWPTPPVGGSTPIRTGPQPSSPAGPNATPTGPTPSAAGQGGTGPNATATGLTPLAPNQGGTGPNTAHAGPVPLAADQGGVRRPSPKAAPRAVPPPPGWTETRPAADGVAPPAATWREAGQGAPSGERSDATPPSTAWREDGQPGLTPRSPAPGRAGADQSGWNAATPISVPPVNKADGGQSRQAGPVPVPAPPVDGSGGPGRPTSPAAPGVARAQSLGDLPGVQGRGPSGSQDSRPVAQPGGRTEQPRGEQAGGGSDGRSSDAVRRDGQPSGQPAGRGGAPAGQAIPGGTQAGQANPGGTQAGQANPGGTQAGQANPGGTQAGQANPGGAQSEPTRNASSGPIAGGATVGRPTVALPRPVTGTDHGDTAARERIGFPLTRPGQAGPDAAQNGPEGAQTGPEALPARTEAAPPQAHAEATSAQIRTDAAPDRPTAEDDRAAVPAQPEKDRADMVRDWADIDQPYMDADGALHNLRPIARLETSGPDTEPRRYSDTALGSGWFVSKTPAKTEDATGTDEAAEATPEETKPAESETAGAAETTAEDEQPQGPELAPHLPLTAADLSAIRWRLDRASLREVVDDRSALRELGERLDGPLADEADNIVKAGLLSVRAEVYRLLGELGMAAAAARLALAHAESAQDLQSQVIAQAELAHVLRLRGDYMEADRLFQRAVDADVPAAVRSVVHENAGRSCFDQNRHMEALDHFARAIRLGSPEDTDLVERIGVCLEAVYIHVLRDGWGPYPRKSPEIRAPLGARPAAEGEEALTESTAEHPVVDPRR
ncbi:hypothetical protein KZ829_16715 [Actinoplanes hulinensis]|uniref:Tetratricopeptide repeat protein n=1 Tax=Actinoplanes hulinensis TaxID=1144547 RepID=A0ABS7B389_9ACTN|nr:hypothetical protein [Actinoplanes hulinensis]MBW6435382.1 hypothetical protein [Actinoplanes hulinensis]